jgi:hypothetical protein
MTEGLDLTVLLVVKMKRLVFNLVGTQTLTGPIHERAMVFVLENIQDE